MNPYGIHRTGPLRPFAKALWVNSFGIRENPVICRRIQRGYVEAGAASGECSPAERTRGQSQKSWRDALPSSG